MDWIRDWAMSLSMVIVFGTFVELLLPGENYRKYIHLVLGVLMLISITDPIVGALNGKFSFELTQDDGKVYEISREKLEFNQQKKVIDIYKKTLESNLRTSIEAKFPYLSGEYKIKITVDESDGGFGRVTHAAVIIDGENPGAEDMEEIKKCAAETLGLTIDNVAVVM